MTYEIVLDAEAVADLKSFRAYDRTAILDTIERNLSVGPTAVGRSRIKRLRGVDSPQFRLRVGEYRVFYDVAGRQVHVMRVLAKRAVDAYLREMGYAPEGD